MNCCEDVRQLEGEKVVWDNVRKNKETYIEKRKEKRREEARGHGVIKRGKIVMIIIIIKTRWEREKR